MTVPRTSNNTMLPLTLTMTGNPATCWLYVKDKEVNIKETI